MAEVSQMPVRPPAARRRRYARSDAGAGGQTGRSRSCDVLALVAWPRAGAGAAGEAVRREQRRRPRSPTSPRANAKPESQVWTALAERRRNRSCSGPGNDAAARARTAVTVAAGLFGRGGREKGPALALYPSAGAASPTTFEPRWHAEPRRRSPGRRTPATSRSMLGLDGDRRASPRNPGLGILDTTTGTLRDDRERDHLRRELRARRQRPDRVRPARSGRAWNRQGQPLRRRSERRGRCSGSPPTGAASIPSGVHATSRMTASACAATTRRSTRSGCGGSSAGAARRAHLDPRALARLRAHAARLLRRRHAAARGVRRAGHERSVDRAGALGPGARRAGERPAGRRRRRSRATARDCCVAEGGLEGPAERANVVTVPFAGGAPTLLVAHAAQPSWNE